MKSPLRRSLRETAARHATLVTAICFVVLGSSSQSWAQKNSPKNDKQAATGVGTEIAKAVGRLDAQQGQTLKITTPEKNELFLVVGQDTVIHYTAEADAKWLAPGQYVRFSAPFDAQGKSASPIKSIEIFVPAILPRMTPEQVRDQTAGVYIEGKAPPAGAKGLFTEEKGAGKDAKAPGKAPTKAAEKQPAAAPPGTQNYRIVGVIAGVQQNIVAIQAGQQPIQVELDPSVAIKVSAADMSFAAQGDEVQVSGLKDLSQPAYIQAEKLEIKAPKKLTQTGPTSRTQRGKSSKSSKKAPAGNDKAPGAGKAGDKAAPGTKGAAKSKDS